MNVVQHQKERRKALKTFFLYSYPKAVAPFFVKKTLQPRWPQKASEVQTVHTKRKKIKSYLLGDQVSALSDKIEKLFNIIRKFGPLIGPPWYKMTRKGQICTMVALSGGQICKASLITSQFPQIMQKLGHPVGNFWCSFIWCTRFWPRRLFEVTKVVMYF